MYQIVQLHIHKRGGSKKKKIFFASVINEWPLTKKYIKSNQKVIKASYLNQLLDANKTCNGYKNKKLPSEVFHEK